MEVSPEYAVQMHGITKTFGTFCALDNVSLDVKKQTIHAILGENGAGKSTLMNVLYGLLSADAGEVYLAGERAHITGPLDAIAKGIGMVHQHFMLIENFTVTENIVLGDEVCRGAGVLDMKTAREKVAKIVQEYGFDIDLDAKIEDITVGMQQRVEIIKALYRGAETLILDEPTAVLTPQEIDQLIKIMRELVAKGKTVIIITHKLKEILASADVCTIIRRGKYMGTVDVPNSSEEELASKMVGRHVNLTVDKNEMHPTDCVLQISDLHVKDARGIEQVCGLDLCVRSGEIVGLAGIDGNGQDELVDCICGLVKCESGTITMHGKEIQNKKPREIIDEKIATIPADRQRYGLVLPFSVEENAVLERHGEEQFGKGIRLDFAKMHDFTTQLIEEYDIRPADCAERPAAGLSGGNQQKVIIARQVSSQPDLLIAVQPTRGLDVGAIEFVHKALIRERDRGAAILLVSLELDEVMDVADTIAVIHHGKICGTFKQHTVTEEEVGLLMAGGGAHE